MTITKLINPTNDNALPSEETIIFGAQANTASWTGDIAAKTLLFLGDGSQFPLETIKFNSDKSITRGFVNYKIGGNELLDPEVQSASDAPGMVKRLTISVPEESSRKKVQLIFPNNPNNELPLVTVISNGEKVIIKQQNMEGAKMLEVGLAPGCALESQDAILSGFRIGSITKDEDENNITQYGDIINIQNACSTTINGCTISMQDEDVPPIGEAS